MEWPVSEGRGSTHYLATATASGSTNTKGSWSEVTSSLDREVCGFHLNVYSALNSSERNRYLFDIGIGSAGSEVVVVPNLHWAVYGATATSTEQISSLYIPLALPKGARLAVRVQSNVASQVLYFGLVPIVRTLSTPAGLSYFEALGANTALSRGTLVGTGTIIDPRFGGSVELTASASRTYRWISVFAGAYGDILGTFVDSLPIIQIGAAGSEIDLVYCYQRAVVKSANHDNRASCVYSGPCHIPKGTRVSALSYWGAGSLGSSEPVYIMAVVGG